MHDAYFLGEPGDESLHADLVKYVVRGEMRQVSRTQDIIEKQETQCLLETTKRFGQFLKAGSMCTPSMLVSVEKLAEGISPNQYLYESKQHHHVTPNLLLCWGYNCKKINVSRARIVR